MTKSETIGKLAEALAKAQGAFLPIEKTKSAKVRMKAGGEYEFDYADLHSVLMAVTPALTANGLALMQDAEAGQGAAVKVSTMLIHSSGEWIQSAPVSVPVEGTRPQEIGGAISYARRYALASLLSVASTDEDDDANAAEGNKATISRRTANTPSPAGDVALKFGRGKDKTLSEVSDDDIRWYVSAWERDVADPTKEKFHATSRKNIATAHAILASRAKPDGTPASKWERVKALAPTFSEDTLRTIVKDATGKTSAGALDEVDFAAIATAIAAHRAGDDIRY